LQLGWWEAAFLTCHHPAALYTAAFCAACVLRLFCLRGSRNIVTRSDMRLRSASTLPCACGTGMLAQNVRWPLA